VARLASKSGAHLGLAMVSLILTGSNSPGLRKNVDSIIVGGIERLDRILCSRRSIMAKGSRRTRNA